MNKRRFRKEHTAASPASYPTLEEFDRGRRDFLARLGAALGVGGLVLAGCDPNRTIALEPDLGPGPSGAAPPMDAKVDRWPDSQGKAAPPDSRVDMEPPSPGGAPQLDARIDSEVPTLGDAPQPDARIDGTQVSPGYAPLMEAGIDGDGGCPVP